MSNCNTANIKTFPSEFITIQNTELRKHDILCGRGTGPNEYCGNKNFLKLVAERRNEYISTSNRTKKAQIAKEIIDQVRNLSPPGRFLEKLKNSCKRSTSPAVWMVALDEKKCLEKVKQALRETWHRKSAESDSSDLSSGRTSLESNINQNVHLKRRVDPKFNEKSHEENSCKKIKACNTQCNESEKRLKIHIRNEQMVTQSYDQGNSCSIRMF